MTKQIEEYLNDIRDAIDIKWNTVREKDNEIGGIRQNATLYFKTRYINNYGVEREIEETPLNMLSSLYSCIDDGKIGDKNIDVIIPIILNTREYEHCKITENNIIRVSSGSAMFKVFKRNNWQNKVVLCDNIQYTGDRSLLYSITDSKLLYLITISRNSKISAYNTIHFYFHESIFREDTIMNKYLRKVYQSLYETQTVRNIFGASYIIAPEICMGIPNISYQDWWPVYNISNMEQQRQEILQSHIDSFINCYE